MFKGLLTLHQMIRTGQTEALLEVLARNDVLRLRNIYSQQFQGTLHHLDVHIGTVYTQMLIDKTYHQKDTSPLRAWALMQTISTAESGCTET